MREICKYGRITDFHLIFLEFTHREANEGKILSTPVATFKGRA